MARDGGIPRQLVKVEAATNANAITVAFSFATDLPGVSVFELRHIVFGFDEAAGVSTGGNGMDPTTNLVITQGSLKFIFWGHRYAGNNERYFPDGLDLKASDGDTVNIVLRMATTSGASIARYCFIRGIPRKY